MGIGVHDVSSILRFTDKLNFGLDCKTYQRIENVQFKCLNLKNMKISNINKIKTSHVDTTSI